MIVDFGYFFNIYVFDVGDSYAGIPTELPCFGDFKNSGQLPKFLRLPKHSFVD